MLAERAIGDRQNARMMIESIPNLGVSGAPDGHRRFLSRTARSDERPAPSAGGAGWPDPVGRAGDEPCAEPGARVPQSRGIGGLGLFGPTLELAGAGVSPAGRPRLPIRLMASLLYLKHAFNLRDEAVVERWSGTRSGNTSAAGRTTSRSCLVMPRRSGGFARPSARPESRRSSRPRSIRRADRSGAASAGAAPAPQQALSPRLPDRRALTVRQRRRSLVAPFLGGR